MRTSPSSSAVIAATGVDSAKRASNATPRVILSKRIVESCQIPRKNTKEVGVGVADVNVNVNDTPSREGRVFQKSKMGYLIKHCQRRQCRLAVLSQGQ
mmetsp:Transcript_6337/g.12684  ORF Transcript_6337/g.12684 Transcript_6337/m.12684 type:complete len:98 (+) Transcript_6337:1827-2120(+)